MFPRPRNCWSTWYLHRETAMPALDKPATLHKGKGRIMSVSLNGASSRKTLSLFGGSLAAIAMIVLLVGQVGCSHDGGPGGGPMRVSLSYTPEHAKDSIRAYPGEVPQTKIYVGTFDDQRDRKDAIGQNVENGTIPIYSTSDPAEFVRQTLATQLRRAGLHVVDDQAQADRIITGRLLRFWVIESNNYEAEISAAI